jgi:hypothetical protein
MSCGSQEYFQIIIPQLLELISNAVPPAYRRAAAFAISRLLAADKMSLRKIFLSILLPILHNPFLQLTPDLPTLDNSFGSSQKPSPYIRPIFSPTKALSTLEILLINADPSPTQNSTLLSPIVSCLYTLMDHLHQIKTADPILKESLRGLLGTWGRVVESQEAVEILWAIIEGDGGDWELLVDRKIKRIPKCVISHEIKFALSSDL